MEANSTGGQDLRRAVAPSDDDDDWSPFGFLASVILYKRLIQLWMRLSNSSRSSFLSVIL